MASGRPFLGSLSTFYPPPIARPSPQVALARSSRLARYAARPDLNARMPGFRTRMGFGLHVGWAIEGPIGGRQGGPREGRVGAPELPRLLPPPGTSNTPPCSASPCFPAHAPPHCAPPTPAPCPPASLPPPHAPRPRLRVQGGRVLPVTQRQHGVAPRGRDQAVRRAAAAVARLCGLPVAACARAGEAEAALGQAGSGGAGAARLRGEASARTPVRP
jgi:hypothetical protein